MQAKIEIIIELVKKFFIWIKKYRYYIFSFALGLILGFAPLAACLHSKLRMSQDLEISLSQPVRIDDFLIRLQEVSVELQTVTIIKEAEKEKKAFEFGIDNEQHAIWRFEDSGIEYRIYFLEATDKGAKFEIRMSPTSLWPIISEERIRKD